MPKAKGNTEQIVLLLHGIRTQAPWTDMVKKVLESSGKLRVKPIKYGFFDTFRFLFPFLTRKAPVRRFIREYRDAKLRYPNARISVIAHSFGTYVVAKAIEQETDIVLDKLLLCGSIIPNSFRVAPFRAQLGNTPVLNECGVNDNWPVVAKSVTWGYGSTGTFGFGTDGIEDRFHEFAHSGYFDESFVRDYWLPFLLDGNIKPSELVEPRPTPPYWQSVLGNVPLRWLLPTIAAIAIPWYLFAVFKAEPTVSIDEKLYISHWLGLSQVSMRLHFENKFGISNHQMQIDRAILIFPDKDNPVFGGLAYPMMVESIVQCNGKPQFGYIVEVAWFGETVCDVNLIEYINNRPAVWEEIQRIYEASNVANLLPDVYRTLIADDTLDAFKNEAHVLLKWQPGSWQLDIEYSGGATSSFKQFNGRKRTSFEVFNDDVQYFKNAISSYNSGIGVFFIWRNVLTNQYRLVHRRQPGKLPN